jgi:hypothetical protein
MVHNSYWILKNFVKENSTKSKLNILGELGKTVGTVGNPSFEWVGFLGGDFVIFKPKVREILNFE